MVNPISAAHLMNGQTTIKRGDLYNTLDGKNLDGKNIVPIDSKRSDLRANKDLGIVLMVAALVAFLIISTVILTVSLHVGLPITHLGNISFITNIIITGTCFVGGLTAFCIYRREHNAYMKEELDESQVEKTLKNIETRD